MGTKASLGNKRGYLSKNWETDNCLPASPVPLPKVYFVPILILTEILPRLCQNPTKAGIGGFRGGQVGATATLHEKNSAGRPISCKKRGPHRDRTTLFISLSKLLQSKTYKSRRYLASKQRNFLYQEFTIFQAPLVRSLIIVLFAPSL